MSAENQAPKLRVTLTVTREVTVKEDWMVRENHETETVEVLSLDALIEEYKESVLEDPFAFIDNANAQAEVKVEKL